MSLSNLLCDVICRYFEKSVGIFQCKKDKHQGLLLQFKTSVDYENEEGYRYKDLFIFAYSNYVGVYARDRWNVIPVEDLEYHNGDTYVKTGKSYYDDTSEWVNLSYHDCCWRPAVENFLREHKHALLVWDSQKLLDFPLQVIEVGEPHWKPEHGLATPTLKEMEVARQARYGR